MLARKKKEKKNNTLVVDTAAPFICDAALHLLYRDKPVHSFCSPRSHVAPAQKNLVSQKKGGISKQKAIKEVLRFAAGGI